TQERQLERQREVAKAQEARDQEREIAADQTEDELTEMRIAFERQQKIVETFQAQVSAIEQNAEMDQESKEQLVAAMRDVLAKTLNPPTTTEKPAEIEEGKEPLVL